MSDRRFGLWSLTAIVGMSWLGCGDESTPSRDGISAGVMAAIEALCDERCTRLVECGRVTGNCVQGCVEDELTRPTLNRMCEPSDSEVSVCTDAIAATPCQAFLVDERRVECDVLCER